MAGILTTQYEWKENLTLQEWDHLLAKLNGHPLQSAKWGTSRKISCDINYHHWAAFKNGNPVFLVRFEERVLLKFLRIAWVPKGPVTVEDQNPLLRKEFLSRLKERKFFLCATNPWEKIEFIQNTHSFFYTIWIDLEIGKEKLWMNLQKQCRNDVKRAKKSGLVVEQSHSLDDLHAFYKICESISKSKGFCLGNSAQSMSYLLSNSNEQEPIQSYLFVARHKGNICGGAFLMTCGSSVHYLWGAVDRRFSHLCIGEALQWGILEWAANNHYKKYDLEGISSKQDSGVDRFKKKLGGTVIACPGIQIYPLTIGHQFVSFIIKMYLLWKAKIWNDRST